MTKMDDITLRIRQIMEYYNLSISETARRIDIAQSNLSAILSGKRPVGSNMINRFIITFEVSKRWLETGDGEMFIKNDKECIANRIKLVLDNCKIINNRDFAEKVDVFQKEIDECISDKMEPSCSLLYNIVSSFPDISTNWLITGNGSMLKSEESTTAIAATIKTRPRVPYAAAAGSLTSSVDGVTDLQCEQIPIITAFPTYDFTILIKGDSMYPNYEGGDEVACKRIDSTSFIQWGKVHVLDTAQGIVIKRVYEDGGDIKCVSYNKEYPDFTIQKDEVYSMSLVVGLLRL